MAEFMPTPDWAEQYKQRLTEGDIGPDLLAKHPPQDPQPEQQPAQTQGEQ